MFPSDTDNETKVTLETSSSIQLEDAPFHLLFLGDWSGRKDNSADSDSSDVQPIEIDRDNFEEVLNKLDVTANLVFSDVDKNVLSLRFASLDDFHPDNIFQMLPLFNDLRDIRRRLLDSKSYNQAAREVKSWFNSSEDAKKTGNGREDDAGGNSNLSVDNLLDQILDQSGEKSQASHSQTTKTSELSAFIKGIVTPHLIQIDTVEQSDLLMVIDEIISDLMRKILHHPDFQSLESAWRGIHFLVYRVETSSDLKIYLLDITKNEFALQLKNNNALQASALQKILKPQTDFSGTIVSWAAICANYTFSLNVEDVSALIRIGEIADASSAPFISHIKPEIFGFDSFGEADSHDVWKVFENSAEEKLWTALRVMPESASLGLVAARVLSRLPYGEKTEPTERFYFEEFTETIAHEKYLWTNPAFAVALLLTKTFQEHGWNMSQNFFREIDGLPLHLYRDEGETKSKSCAEILLTQSNHELLLEYGFIPVVTYKDADRIAFSRYQSVAYPPQMLKGRWS